MIELNKKFVRPFFSAVYPKRSRPKFTCKRIPNYSTIQFSAKIREFNYVVEVYELHRTDCKFSVAAIKRHFSDSTKAKAEKFGDVWLDAPKFDEIVTNPAGWHWKTMILGTSSSGREMASFSSIFENVNIFVYVTGMELCSAQVMRNIMTKILSDLVVVDDPKTWIEE